MRARSAAGGKGEDFLSTDAGRETNSKILLVDTDEGRAEELAEILRRKNFETILCYYPLKAMATIRRERPDAVILEVIMAGRSGFEIAARMQADPLLARTPIIFTSDIQNSAGGNHDYFPRPIDESRFVETLRNRISRERADGGPAKENG
jgi:PleD family two-component response regulator